MRPRREWLSLEEGARESEAGALVWADALEEEGRLAAAVLARVHAWSFAWPAGPGPHARTLVAAVQIGPYPLWATAHPAPAATRCAVALGWRWLGCLVYSPDPGTGQTLWARWLVEGSSESRLRVRGRYDRWRLGSARLILDVGGNARRAALTAWLTEAYELLVPRLPPRPA